MPKPLAATVEVHVEKSSHVGGRIVVVRPNAIKDGDEVGVLDGRSDKLDVSEYFGLSDAVVDAEVSAVELVLFVVDVEPDIDIEAGSVRRLVGDEARDTVAPIELTAGIDATIDGDNEIEALCDNDAMLELDDETLPDDVDDAVSLAETVGEELCDDDIESLGEDEALTDGEAVSITLASALGVRTFDFDTKALRDDVSIGKDVFDAVAATTTLGDDVDDCATTVDDMDAEGDVLGLKVLAQPTLFSVKTASCTLCSQNETS